MDAAERALLTATIHDAVADAAHADTALHELGWLDLLQAEPDDAIAIVFDALGTTNATASILDDVFVAALGLAPQPELAALLPAYGTWSPPGNAGLATARIERASELLVVGTEVVVVPVSRATVTAMGGIDPDARMSSVRVETAAAVALDHDAWDHAVARCQRALAHQTAGATRAMLDLARQHAVDRVQFGTPIARFQAVRHRLADSLVAIEALDAALTAAADAPGPETAALAKAFAGRTARTVATHCQQVLAGIGFTTDHPFYRYLKRTMLLDGIFGSTDDLVVAIGRQLLASRHVPTLVEL
jgi:hypothetical protein